MSRKRNKLYDNAALMYKDGRSVLEIATWYNLNVSLLKQALRFRGIKIDSKREMYIDAGTFRGELIMNHKANEALGQAIKKGFVERKTVCEKCGKDGVMSDGRSSVMGHHDDYNDPLVVRWLCAACHRDWHKKNRAIPFVVGFPEHRIRERWTPSEKKKKEYVTDPLLVDYYREMISTVPGSKKLLLAEKMGLSYRALMTRKYGLVRFTKQDAKAIDEYLNDEKETTES